MSDFPLYALSEEHQAVREAVRAVCDAKVAPAAAQVDEAGEFPQAAYDALAVSDFAAPHVAEQYGGAGADALATCIVIEEVARACASSSLIPAVNKLGSLPLLLSAGFWMARMQAEFGNPGNVRQQRASRPGDRTFWGDLDDLFGQRADDVFLVKVSYWLSR